MNSFNSLESSILFYFISFFYGLLCAYNIILCSFTLNWALRVIGTFSDKQSRSIKNSENFLTKSTFDEMTYIKNITRLLDTLNNKYDNFCPIWSNDDSISSQENRLEEYYPIFSLLKFPTMNEQTWENRNNIRIYKFTSSNLIGILSRKIYISTTFYRSISTLSNKI